MLRPLALFELRYQARNPVLWGAAAALFLLAFAAITAPNLRIGAPGSVHVNAPRAIAQMHIVFAILSMFLTAAFVANAVVRDDETGFGPILRTTRLGKGDYLLGRFLGAFAAAALAFLAVPLGLAIGSAMPWLDPETVGPGRVGDYAYGYLLLGLPALFLTSAMFFALAALTRSTVSTFLAVIVFLILYLGVGAVAGGRPELRDAMALVEPFGNIALQNATRYWTAAESNAATPPFTGALLWGRVLWLSLGAVALALACRAYRFTARAKRAKKRPAQAAEAPPHPVAERLPDPHFDAATPRAQLRARTRLEMKLVLRSPGFLILLFLGLANTAASLWLGGDLYGTPTLPVTREVIPVLITNFSIIPAVIAIYYSGELVWRERDRRIHEIVDATPLPGWAYLVPKMLAVASILLTTLLLSAVVGILTQLLEGFTHVEPGKYLLWYILPIGFDLILLAALAVFVQAVSPHKFVGWGVMVLYVVLRLSGRSAGLDHGLYIFGQVPDFPFSDMNGAGTFWQAAWWYRFYWGAFAALLLIAAHLLWRRGTETRLRPRLARVPAGLRGALGRVAAAALVAAIGSGGWILYNTAVLNAYRSSADNERFAADYERKYLRFESLPQPAISGVQLDVALYPAERRAVVRGRYELTNRTAQSIRDVHVRLLERELELLGLDFPGARVISNDPTFGYRIYRLDRPMAPGDTRMFTFQTRRWPRGFQDRGSYTNLVGNGTFIHSRQITPSIGMDRHGLVEEPENRRRLGLSPELRPAKLEDLSATGRSLFGGEWTRADITVSTDAAQTPIAPGRRVSDVTAEGRRTARFVAEAPILTLFSIQSARYAERHRLHKGVDLVVYYHPAHAWNVERMLDALAAALDYYQANFGPYPFTQARIVEFPAYAGFAQAFAGTMPFSELIGFVADAGNPRGADHVTSVTAHELAHQYWGHQVMAANVQGGTMLGETLSQYSALMVMKRLYGEHGIRRFLRAELDNYLRSRSFDPAGELPLARVENQGYIHYNKGSLAMYLLQQRLGEAALNRALARFLRRYRFGGPPYPRSTDLVALLRAEAKSSQQQALISDLFERITLYDLRADKVHVVRQRDGYWRVRVPVEARKLYADADGTERESPFREDIELGLFLQEPASPGFTSQDVIWMQRVPIRSGKQVLTFITAKKPRFVAIDPYNYYLDRNPADNVTPTQ
jgi:ABC-type Na+ efflux pump permease subunit